MSKRLKKAVALMASFVLWLVSISPDRDLSAVARMVDGIATHPYRALGAALALALAVYALWDWLLDVLGIHTRKRLESDIRGWLDSFSFGLKREMAPGTYFNFSVTPEGIPPFTVALPKDLDRYVMIGARLGLTETDKEFVHKMALDELDILKANLGLILSRGRVGYKMDLPANEITIQHRVPVTPDLTEHVFMTAVDELIIARAGAISALVMLVGQARGRALAEARPTEAQPKELES
jgi:hypothetical protein